MAEFCRAGQVRGLPQSALDGLVRRRFALRPGTNVPVSPLRLENKEAFITRHRGSPNETDACALAALAVRERLGVMPYGSAPAPSARAILTGAYREQPPQMSSSDDPDYDNNSFDDIGLYAPD